MGQGQPVDDGTLRRLWAKTLPSGADFEEAPTDLTYRPPAAGARSESATEALPTVAVGRGAAPGPVKSTDATVSLSAGERPRKTPRGPKGAAAAPAPAPEPPKPPTSPPYELIEEIGRGGMGVVYRARQGSLQREVAIKKTLADASGLEDRFVAEALVTGLLDHPNIVPVHDLGRTSEGEVLLAMKLVDGVSWRDLLHPKKDEHRRRLEGRGPDFHYQVLLSVCNAVAFAHSKGIVHCDLKPENVMVGEFGEVLVMDWGIAVDVRGERPAPDARTQHRSAVDAPCGTPAYMPPELAEGRGRDLGPGTDVYLLGAILHEVVTGRPPHTGRGLHMVLEKAIASRPPEYGKEVSPGLQAILRRAMAREPAARFPTVTEFRAALESYLRHRESARIAADAFAALERCVGRWSVAAEGAGRSGLYADFAEAVAGFKQARVLWAENPEAAEGERRARVAYADAALKAGDVGLAEAQAEALDPALPEAAALRERIAAARAERAAATRAARRLKIGLAVAAATIVAGLSIGIALVSRERQKAEERLAGSLLGQGDMLAAQRRFAEARRVYDEARELFERRGASGFAADLGLFSVERRAPRPLLAIEAGAIAAPFDLRFSADGRWIAGGARRWDSITGEPAPADAPEVEPGRPIDADWPLSVRLGEDGIARRVRRDGSTVDEFRGHAGPVLAAAHAPTGRIVVTAGRDRTVRVWDVQTRKELRLLRGHEGPVAALAISTDSRFAFAGGHDGTARLWDLQTGDEVALFAEGRAPILAVALERDGRRAASAATDGRIRIWDLVRAPRAVRPFEAARADADRGPDDRERGPHRSSCVAISRDGRLALAAGEGGTVRVFDVATGREVRALAGHRDEVTAVAFGADPRTIFSRGKDGAVREWDLATGLPRQGDARFPMEPAGAVPAAAIERIRAGHADAVVATAPAPEERALVSASADGTWRLWTEDGREIRAFETEGEGGAPLAIACTPDARTVVTAGGDGLVRLWDLGRPARERALAPRPGDGPALARWYAFRGRPDLAVECGGADPLLLARAHWERGYHVAAQREIARAKAAHAGDFTVDLAARAIAAAEAREGSLLSRPPGIVRSATFSADGARVLLASSEGALEVVEVATGRVLSRIAPGKLADIYAAALSPDARVAVSGEKTGPLTAWDAATGRALWKSDEAQDSFSSAAFSRDGTVLAIAGSEPTVRLFDPATGAVRRAIETGEQSISAVAFAKDGARLAIAARSGTIIVWDPATGRQVRHIAKLDAAPETLAFSPDGSLLAAALGWNVRIWNAATGEEARVLEAPGASAYGVAFSPDGRRLAATNGQGAVRVWETARWTETHAFEDHGGAAVLGVAWSPDGKLLLTFDNAGAVRVRIMGTG